MKKLIVLIFPILVACGSDPNPKFCYECTTAITTSCSVGCGPQSTNNKEYCDFTDDQAKNVERQNTTSYTEQQVIQGTSNSQIVTWNQKTTCTKKQ